MWGCDEPSKRGMWELLCFKCLGKGLDETGEICGHCEGKRKIPQNRCPNSLLNRPDIIEVFDAYAFFKNYKVLPVSGGLYDQTSFFIKTINFCDQVSSTLDKLNTEKNQAIKDMAKKRQTEGKING